MWCTRVVGGGASASSLGAVSSCSRKSTSSSSRSLRCPSVALAGGGVDDVASWRGSWLAARLAVSPSSRLHC